MIILKGSTPFGDVIRTFEKPADLLAYLKRFFIPDCVPFIVLFSDDPEWYDTSNLPRIR